MLNITQFNFPNSRDAGRHAGRQANINRQAGMTLMETMIALALSLVVTAAMVSLMANSLGTATRIIQMSQLTDELRNAMSMMSRDVRRANYSANAAFCYANPDCGIDGSVPQFADIAISGGSCFTYGLDRNWDGDAAADAAGGFRRMTTGGIGRVEMWIGDNAPDCASTTNVNWVAITDPDFVDITAFAVNDNASFTGSIGGEAGSTITHRTREIEMQINGRLIRDNNIIREVKDTIKARNDVITKS